MSIHSDQNSRILIVEDDPILLQSLTSNLSPLGYQMHSASTLDQAIQELQLHIFGFILSDITLGEDSGIVLIDLIQSLPKKQVTPPLVFMTEDPSHLTQKELKSYTVLIKPFPLDRLLWLLECHFYRAQLT